MHTERNMQTETDRWRDVESDVYSSTQVSETRFASTVIVKTVKRQRR